MVIISPEIPCTWLSLPVFGSTCKTAGQPWAELCPPHVKLLALNCMAYLCFLVSLFYKVLCPHIWKWSFVNTWKHLRTLKLPSWHQHCAMNLPCFSLSHGIDDGNGVRYELSLKAEFLLLLDFKICNHQIKIWSWRITNMAWIVTIFPHTA